MKDEKHRIPIMTHALSRYWDQPSVESILIDDDHALMTSKTFIHLKTYNCSNPSGVYQGKMWKRSLQVPRGWILCWFEDVPNEPGYCDVIKRKIIIV